MRRNALLFRLATLCLARPRATLLAGGMVTALLASGLPRLELRTDGRAIYPTGNPVVEQSERDAETFQDPSQVIVLVSARPGGPPVASTAGLLFLQDIDRDLRALPVVRSRGVRSLASLKDPATRRGALPSVRDYLDEIPSDPAGLEALLARIRLHPLAEGLFLAADGSAAALYAPLAQDLPRSEAVDDLERWAERRTGAGFDIRLTGPVVAEVSLGRKVLRDLAWTIPAMLAVMAVLLFVCLRTRGAVLAVLAEVSVVLVCILGLMGHLGIPVTLVTTIMPIVLLVMAVADEVHFLERLQSFQGERMSASPADRRASAGLALQQVERPMTLTSLTTVAGFLAFPASDIVPLRDFGLLAAGGILLALLSSFTLIPALVVSLPLSWWRPIARKAAAPERALSRFESWICRHEGAAFGIGAGLVLAAVPGIFFLAVQDSWIDNFHRSSPVASAHRIFNEKLWGTYRFDIVLTSREPQRFRQPEGVRLVEEVVRAASTAPHAGGVVSYLTSLRLLSDLTGKTREISQLPPDDLRTLNALALLLRNSLDMDQLLTRDARSARVRIHVKDADYRHGLEIRRHLERSLAPLLAGRGVTAHFSGDLPIAVEVVRAISTSQLASIGWSLAGIALLLTLAFRSVLRSAVVLAPVLAAAAVVFGALGYLGMPLGVASSMFLALSIGSGIDFALHLAHAYGDARTGGAEHAGAVQSSLATAGRAVRWNALVLGLGFLILALSSLKPNRVLGILLGAAMLAAYLMTLLLLPRLLEWSRGARFLLKGERHEQHEMSVDRIGPVVGVLPARQPLGGSGGPGPERVSGVRGGGIRAFHHHDPDHPGR